MKPKYQLVGQVQAVEGWVGWNWKMELNYERIGQQKAGYRGQLLLDLLLYFVSMHLE